LLFSRQPCWTKRSAGFFVGKAAREPDPPIVEALALQPCFCSRSFQPNRSDTKNTVGVQSV